MRRKPPCRRTSAWKRTFWSGQIKTRYKSSAPNVRLYGETPGCFPAHDWNLGEGRLLLDVDVDNSRNVCVLGSGLATNIFPNSSPVGERVKIDGINYTVVGVLEPKGGALGGDQDNFAVVPLTTGLNRYGRWWRSLNILVQARDRAELRRHRGGGARHDARHPQSAAGQGGRF